jgi:hypothetical protein
MGPKVFVSYAREDSRWRKLVCKQLGVIEKASPTVLQLWDDQMIRGGDDWRARIQEALADSSIALMLISEHFLTSDFIINVEVHTFFQLCEQKGTVLYPLLIQPCAWQLVPWLAKKQIRPSTPKPRALSLFSKPRQRQILAEVATEIADIATRVAAARQIT